MLYELEDIGYSVRTVKVYIALLLADEGLVTLWFEEFPGTDKVLHNVDIRACFDVEVSCIKESADVQSGNEFQRLILCICRCPLAVQVKMIALWCLKIAFFEGLTVPGAIAFVHIHVVHVDRHPHIGSGISDLVIDMLVDEEVVSLCLSILDIVDTRCLDCRKVKFHIIIFKVRAPRLDCPLKGLLRCSVGIDPHQRSCSLRLVFLIEFDDCHLRLLRGIANL